MQEAAHIDANIIFGTVIDDSLGDEVRVTVIAAGFDGGAVRRRPVQSGAAGRSAIGARPQARSDSRPTSTSEPCRRPAAHQLPAESAQSDRRFRRNGQSRAVAGDPTTEGEDDVDVPSFMRRRVSPSARFQGSPGRHHSCRRASRRHRTTRSISVITSATIRPRWRRTGVDWQTRSALAFDRLIWMEQIHGRNVPWSTGPPTSRYPRRMRW